MGEGEDEAEDEEVAEASAARQTSRVLRSLSRSLRLTALTALAPESGGLKSADLEEEVVAEAEALDSFDFFK